MQYLELAASNSLSQTKEQMPERSKKALGSIQEPFSKFIDTGLRGNEPTCKERIKNLKIIVGKQWDETAGKFEKMSNIDHIKIKKH